MNKAVVVVAVAVGLVSLGRLLGRKIQPFDWEKALERMPDNAPPKWMFRNISAIRQNTDRILGLLERERADQPARAKPKASTPPESPGSR